MTLGVALVLRKFGLTVGVRQDMKEKKSAPVEDPAPLGARAPH